MSCVLRLAFLTMATFVCACASTSDYENENPNIPAAAYAADGFTFDVAPPIHPEWKPIKFYFKDCELSSVGDHISKTEYDCFYP